MLKETITYEDFDDKSVTETLYFNISKTELMDNMNLQDEVNALQNMLDGPERELKPREIQMIVDVVKLFMKLSYGIRSEDGKRFIKTEQNWVEFTQTAAYDAFLFSLFEKPDKAMSFLLNIIPASLREEAEKEVQSQQNVELPTAPPELENSTAEVKERTDEELLAMKPQEMSTDELRRAFALKSVNQ